MQKNPQHISINFYTYMNLSIHVNWSLFEHSDDERKTIYSKEYTILLLNFITLYNKNNAF